jgi:hypothetical protein
VEQKLVECIDMKYISSGLFNYLTSSVMSSAPQVADGVETPVKGKLYTRTRRHRIKYPKSYDWTRTVQTVPDPHRWLPRSQRPGQSRRRGPAGGASFIRGPQGLVTTEERKAAGPSTAHIDIGSSKAGGKSKARGRR